MIDSLVYGGPAAARQALGYGAVAAALGALLPVVGHLQRYLAARSQRALTIEAQVRLFARLNQIWSLRFFEDPQSQDRLRMAERGGSETPAQLVRSCIGVSSAIVRLATFVVVIAALSPLLALVVLASGIPSMVAQWRLGRRQAGLARDISPLQRRQFFYRGLLTNDTAVKEIRLFNLGGFFLQRMTKSLRAAGAEEARLDRRVLRTDSSLALFNAAVTLGCLVSVIVRSAQGVYTVGDITLALASLAAVQSGLASIAQNVGELQRAFALFISFAELVTSETGAAQPPSVTAVAPLRSAIELRDVWFRYRDDGPWVLRGVNLRICVGQSVGIVGLNGAGKSTLVKLLCRFYDPDRGSILWDGIDIRHLPIADLRARISALFQDHMCYDLTAAENIGVGDLRFVHDIGHIRQAARAADIDTTLAALPYGYETQLSRIHLHESDATQGVMLSGGQWQRVAIARSMIRTSADLLILDEPNSGLDPEAEDRLRLTLQQYRQGHTSILISHRLNTVRAADHIVVLDEGRIIESGDHVTLLADNGTYARLFTRQARGYTEASADV